MANPRVFISSTCYDLSEVRDSLVDFVRSYGFEPILSDRGDVFFHPDIHTHESCINEVGNCQLFLLIIGGRFGGTYTADTSKSIVNAEYSAAREQKIPVFTFVKRGVYSDHFVFSKNKKNSNLDEIVFPSLEKNSYAKQIFGFIDEVRLAPVNNGFFAFDFARDITELLRKQWAGMFFEFLQQRTARDQFATATSLLDNISVAGDKVEELVKRLYRHIDSAGADATIKDVEIRSVAKRFFEECLEFVTKPDLRFIKKEVSPGPFEHWYEYLAKATDGRVEDLLQHDVGVVWRGHGKLVRSPERPSVEEFHIEQQTRFKVVKTIDSETLQAVIDEFPKKDDSIDKNASRENTDAGANPESFSISILGLTERIIKILIESDIAKLGDLASLKPADLLKIKGIGRKTVDAINTQLSTYGLALAETDNAA